MIKNNNTRLFEKLIIDTYNEDVLDIKLLIIILKIFKEYPIDITDFKLKSENDNVWGKNFSPEEIILMTLDGFYDGLPNEEDIGEVEDADEYEEWYNILIDNRLEKILKEYGWNLPNSSEE